MVRLATASHAPSQSAMTASRLWMLFLVLTLALAVAGCGRDIESRTITAAGAGDLESAESDVEDRIGALSTARSGIPNEDFGLAYVFHEPGVPLLDVESVSLDGGPRQPVGVGRYAVWEVSPGPHLLEAWRGDQRLDSEIIVVAAGEAAYVRYAEKGLYGGVSYLTRVTPNQGRAIVRASRL